MKPVIAAWCGVSAAQKAIGEEFPRKEFHKVVLLTGNASPAAPEPVIAELDHPPRADWPIGPHCFRPVERRFLTSIRAAARLRL